MLKTTPEFRSAIFSVIFNCDCYMLTKNEIFDKKPANELSNLVEQAQHHDHFLTDVVFIVSVSTGTSN